MLTVSTAQKVQEHAPRIIQIAPGHQLIALDASAVLNEKMEEHERLLALEHVCYNTRPPLF